MTGSAPQLPGLWASVSAAKQIQRALHNDRSTVIVLRGECAAPTIAHLISKWDADLTGLDPFYRVADCLVWVHLGALSRCPHDCLVLEAHGPECLMTRPQSWSEFIALDSVPPATARR